MALNRFGQYVRLTVKDRSDTLVFETDSLRVDFDIRNKSGWVRAKVSIYNLTPETINKLTGGENYVTITTSLHGGKEEVLVDELFVSNAIQEIQIPNNITSLFCYSKIRKAVLEKPVSLYIPEPSFKNVVKGILDAAGFTGEAKFKEYPIGYLEKVPAQPRSRQDGSALSCLKILADQHRSYFFSEGNDITFMYRVHSNNRTITTLDEGTGEVQLSTDNMRSNPKIGPATIDIVSNLDSRIKPSVILDISNLLTAGTSVDKESLSVTEGIIKDVVAGYHKFQTFTVQHSGSNFTGDWQTRANAIAPTQGFNMPITNWFR